MSTSQKAQNRIAVIIPENRAWEWHRQMILLLQNSFQVDVYVHGEALRYPHILELWLRLETFLPGDRDLAKLTTFLAPLWVKRADVTYSLIVNFSEQAILCPASPVIEPRYQGHSDSIYLLASLLSGQNPYLSFHIQGEDEPIAASYLAISDRVVLTRGLQNSFTRLIALAERAIKHITQDSRTAILPQPPNLSPKFSLTAMTRFCIRFALDKVFFRFVRKLQIQEHWSVVLLQPEELDVSHELPMQRLVVLPDDGRRFYADPFLFTDGGQRWLFFEELEFRTGKGIISCTQIRDGRHTGVPRPVLERPYHLSYPLVFRHGHDIFMLPETGSNGKVELYRAKSFPFTWMLHRILLDNIALYDATLLEYQNRWWLFGAVSQYGSLPQDELAIFYSDTLEGPWQPHLLNPVKSDCRSARPAGRILVRDNRLIRPAQDCESGYGTALVWCEINELTPEHFDEREVGRWTGKGFMKIKGLHTFDYDDGLAAIDIMRTVWKLPPLVKRRTTSI